MYNIPCKLCFLYMYKAYVLYSFRVFEYADDAYVMKITLFRGLREGSVAF